MSDHSAFSRDAGGDVEGRWSGALASIVRDSGNLNEDQIASLLANVVEGEIIPRLMLAHQTFAATGVDLESEVMIAASEIEPFAKLTIMGELDDLEDHIVKLTRQGVMIEAVYLQLLAPAARKLGEYWEQDVCSFTDVTIGLGRLQTLLYRLSARHNVVEEQEDTSPRGLFVTPFGSQHSFGIRMAEDFFRREGWRTLCEPNILAADLAELLQRESFDLVGIGISTQGQVELAQEMIVQVRKLSRNREVKIMLGGSFVGDHPELAVSLGADFSALDAREAVTKAKNIIYNLV